MYRLSFGTGSLYVQESQKLILIYLNNSSWKDTVEEAVNTNLLQFSSSQSTRRAAREICTRLKSLTPQELENSPNFDPMDQALIAWLACCRTYKFIGDFSTQVLIEKFSSFKLEMSHADFDFFCDEQKLFHKELEDLTDSTEKKLRQILFRMMREAGFLTDDNRIVAGLASQSLIDINNKGKRDLAYFVPGADS